jgi:uncharacterized protein YbjT (DUF2867 family)
MFRRILSGLAALTLTVATFVSFTTFATFATFAGSSRAAEAQDGSVLVFGGTGQLGLEIVDDLLAAGEDVTVFVRPTSDRSALEPKGVSFVIGDVLSESDVEAALKAADFRVVIDALARDRGAEPAFYVDSQRYIAKWSAATGVSQVILHGSVGAGLSRTVYPKDNWEYMSETLMAKDLGERLLMESGVPYTIIRNFILLPATVQESGEAMLTTDQSARGGVTRDGLARLTMECLDNESCLNEIFHAVDRGPLDAPARYRERLEQYQ